MFEYKSLSVELDGRGVGNGDLQAMAW